MNAADELLVAHRATSVCAATNCTRPRSTTLRLAAVLDDATSLCPKHTTAVGRLWRDRHRGRSKWAPDAIVERVRLDVAEALS